MCLAIPSRIVKIEDDMGIIDVEGIRREVSLLLLENAYFQYKNLVTPAP